MIKEKNVDILITVRNVTFYKNLGYPVEIGNNCNIKINDINPNSRYKITAICEKCGSENHISIAKYYKNKNNHNYYSCKKCSRIKFKLTNNILFGADNPMNNSEIKQKAENTNLEKYGFKTSILNSDILNKIKMTNIQRYGHESHLKNEEIRNKIKNTMIDKYGVEYPIQNNDIKTKINNTNLLLYGAEYPIQNEDIKAKMNNTNLLRYGFSSPIKSKIVKLKIAEKFKNKYSDINIVDVNGSELKILCDCGLCYKISKSLFNHKNAEKITLCPKCNPPSNSVKENDIYNFILDNYDDEIIANDKKTISPFELDVYLPKLKLAIEYNGIYWHNERNKENNYHLNKTEMCEQLGIQLIHIYEDEWLYKKDIVKSIILDKLGNIKNKIFATKTEIREIFDNESVRIFLEVNHVRGFVGSKIKFGLFYDNELVSLMIFGQRKNYNDQYELDRFCNKLNTDVVDGASKLFKYFIKNYNPTQIIAYADRSFSRGELYKNLGFSFFGKTQPTYSYVISKKRYNRFEFRKDILVKQGFDPTKTEHEIMLERKIYRIYDSGNLKFIYK